LFYQVRNVNGLKKKPSTSELIDWIKLLLWEKADPNDLEEMDLKQKLPPFIESLIKNEQDLETLDDFKRYHSK